MHLTRPLLREAVENGLLAIGARLRGLLPAPLRELVEHGEG